MKKSACVSFCLFLLLFHELLSICFAGKKDGNIIILGGGGGGGHGGHGGHGGGMPLILISKFLIIRPGLKLTHILF